MLNVLKTGVICVGVVLSVFVCVLLLLAYELNMPHFDHCVISLSAFLCECVSLRVCHPGIRKWLIRPTAQGVPFIILRGKVRPRI